MKMNLSLVLDLDCKIRLDLLKDVELSEIDRYTSTCVSSDKVREDYKDRIDLFLEENKEFISSFKKDSNKKGSIVITFVDEKQKVRKMRVLYADNFEKTNALDTLEEVRKALKKNFDFDCIVSIIEKYRGVIFSSNFDRNLLRRSIYSVSFIKHDANFNDNARVKREKNRLILAIYNKIKGLLISEKPHYKELGYYYLRLIDSHIENKYGVSTTRKIKKSNIHVNLKDISPVVNNNIAIKKENIYYNGQLLTEEEDGQYSMFDSLKTPEEEKTYDNFSAYVDAYLEGIDRESLRK